MSRLSKEKEAEKVYNYYLTKKVYPLIGDKTTYLTELLGAGKKLFGVKFKGVYPSDKIPMLNDLTPYCILNLDSSKESGSHWVALAKCEYPSKDSIIYDSFGRDYKKIIPNLQYTNNGRIKNTDKDSEQEMMETDCGARCIAWLMVVNKHGAELALKV